MLGADDDVALKLPYFRRRLVSLEQWGLGWATGRRETQRAVVRFEVKSPLVGNTSWFEPGSCLQVLSNDEDGDVALPYGRQRLVLVEQRGLGWAAGRKETQRAVARFEVKLPPSRHPELG